MSNLSKMTYDDIENKIMKYLYSNPNTRFNQYSLYNKLLDDILKLNNQSLRLCIAINLTGNDQSIHMGTIKEWHKKKIPELDKKLCVYLIN